jgi:hypothetical protein
MQQNMMDITRHDRFNRSVGVIYNTIICVMIVFYIS